METNRERSETNRKRSTTPTSIFYLEPDREQLVGHAPPPDLAIFSIDRNKKGSCRLFKRVSSKGSARLKFYPLGSGNALGNVRSVKASSGKRP